ncbi:hypothetical protein TcBrA4_0057380 [Trypanosoma cruzi]|nr:hypothetical protein TcBrA4_0057380 [Trypanosoma cruzi]
MHRDGVRGANMGHVKEEMSPQREDAAVESPMMLPTEQHSRVVQPFHAHILFLEDAFFSAEQQKLEMFDLGCAFLVPVDTSRSLTPEQMEGAEQRLQLLLRSFERACQDELATLREEGDALKRRMAHIIAMAEEKWRLAERSRQDDFMEMSVACQKDVAAITAELRSGVLSCLQDSRMSAVLEEALNVKINELRVMQGQLEDLTELRLKEFTEHQKLLQAERERHRERFLVLQEETTRTVNSLTADIERQQRQHLREIREVQRQHTVQVKDLERQLQEEREAHATESQKHTEELDQIQATLKKLEEDKTRLMQELGEQHSQVEEWRRRYNERDSLAKLERIEHQARFDELHVEEAQTFRKQLVDSVRRSASLSFDRPNSNGKSLSRSSAPHSFLMTSESNVQGRHSTGAAEGSIRSLHSHEKRTAVLSPGSSEGSANPYANISLHNPTSSYVRLMNLSEQLKKHIEFN